MSGQPWSVQRNVFYLQICCTYHRNKVFVKFEGLFMIFKFETRNIVPPQLFFFQHCLKFSNQIKVVVKKTRTLVQEKFCPTSKKFREIHNIVFFVQNFMRNSMVHLVRFLRLDKKSYKQKCRGRYFAQNSIFCG